MKAKIQYNINFNRQPIQVDITNESEILLTGIGGQEEMSYSKRNIPFVYNNNLSDELWISLGNIYKNICTELNNFDITNEYNIFINSGLIRAPFRIIVIPYTIRKFDLAPRLMLRELVTAKVFSYGSNQIDITNDEDNTEFIRLTSIGDLVIIDKIKYTITNILNIQNGKKYYLSNNITSVGPLMISNLSRYKSNNYSYVVANGNNYKSMFKFLYVSDVTTTPTQDLTSYDSKNVFLFNSDNAWQLKNFIPNIPFQLDEYQDNIFNKVEKYQLMTQVEQQSLYIELNNVKNITAGDYLIADFTVDGTVYNIELFVKYIDGNRVYVDQDHSIQIPINANIFRNLEYKFFIFVYPEEDYNFNSINTIKLIFEYI